MELMGTQAGPDAADPLSNIRALATAPPPTTDPLADLRALAEPQPSLGSRMLTGVQNTAASALRGAGQWVGDLPKNIISTLQTPPTMLTGKLPEGQTVLDKPTAWARSAAEDYADKSEELPNAAASAVAPTPAAFSKLSPFMQQATTIGGNAFGQTAAALAMGAGGLGVGEAAETAAPEAAVPAAADAGKAEVFARLKKLAEAPSGETPPQPTAAGPTGTAPAEPLSALNALATTEDKTAVMARIKELQKGVNGGPPIPPIAQPPAGRIVGELGPFADLVPEGKPALAEAVEKPNATINATESGTASAAGPAAVRGNVEGAVGPSPAGNVGAQPGLSGEPVLRGGPPQPPPLAPSALVNRARLGLTPEQATQLDTVTNDLTSSGFTKTYRSFDDQMADARAFAQEVGQDPSLVDPAKVRNLSGAQIQGVRTVLKTTLDQMTEMERALKDPSLTMDQAEELSMQLEHVRGTAGDFLRTIVRESGDRGRDLGILRAQTSSSLDPDVWVVRASRVAGRDLTSDEVAEINGLARYAQVICGAAA